MIDVTIIGFGNVGSALSSLLLSNQHDIKINILEPNEQCEGAILDMKQGLSLYHQKEIHINDMELFQESDFVFFTAGTPNIKGGSRLSMAKENSELAKSVFENIQFNKTPIIFIITNPVDIVSHVVYKCTRFHSEQIIGTGTFLDSTRLNYYLSKESNNKTEDFDALVLGEHGSSQVPIFSNTLFNGQPILESSVFTKKSLERARQLTESSAAEIRKTQDATKYAVAKCAEILMNYVIDKKEHTLSVSILTNDHYRNLLQLDHDIYISLPITMKNGKFIINNDMKFSIEELEGLRKSAKIILEYMHI